MARATKSKSKAPYVKVSERPQRILDRAAHIAAADMRLDISKAFADAHSSIGYQRAIRSKFTLDYVYASEKVTDNEFIYRINRIARSSLNGDERQELINFLEQKEIKSRKLEDAELSFLRLARAFVSDSKDSTRATKRDLALSYKIRPRPIRPRMATEESGPVPIRVIDVHLKNLRMADETVIQRYALPDLGIKPISTKPSFTSRAIKRALVPLAIAFLGATVIYGALSNDQNGITKRLTSRVSTMVTKLQSRFDSIESKVDQIVISFMGPKEKLDEMIAKNDGESIVYPAPPPKPASGTIIIEVPESKADQLVANSNGKAVIAFGDRQPIELASQAKAPAAPSALLGAAKPN